MAGRASPYTVLFTIVLEKMYVLLFQHHSWYLDTRYNRPVHRTLQYDNSSHLLINKGFTLQGSLSNLNDFWLLYYVVIVIHIHFHPFHEYSKMISFYFISVPFFVWWNVRQGHTRTYATAPPSPTHTQYKIRGIHHPQIMDRLSLDLVLIIGISFDGVIFKIKR